MSTDELIDRLVKYGVNREEITGRFMGDMELYAICLYQFLDDENFTSLGDALLRADTSAAFEAAHALKGTSGNMGLVQLYKTICEIVELLRPRLSCKGTEELYLEIISERDRLKKLSE